MSYSSSEESRSETSRAQSQSGDGLNKPPPRTHVTEEGRYLSGSREDMQGGNPRPSGIVTLPPTAELGTGHPDDTRGVKITVGLYWCNYVSNLINRAI